MKKFIIIFCCAFLLLTFGVLSAHAMSKFNDCDSYSVIKKNKDTFIVGFKGGSAKYIKTTLSGEVKDWVTLDFELIVDSEKIIELNIISMQELSPKKNLAFAQKKDEIVKEFFGIYLSNPIKYKKDIDAVTGATPQIKLIIKNLNRVRKEIRGIFTNEAELKQIYKQRKRFE